MESLRKSLQLSQIDESKLNDVAQYIKAYVENNQILNKIKDISADIIKKAGAELLLSVLKLYYMLISKDTPIKDKLTILSALLYVVTPVDAVADVLPAGYTDDLALVALVLELITKNITADVERKAQETFDKWINKGE